MSNEDIDVSDIHVNDGALREIDEHDTVVTIKDTKFAAALLGIGVKPYSNPLTVREFASGKTEATWRLEPTDSTGEIRVSDVLWAAKDPLKFILDNPRHELSFALAALLQYQIMLTAIEQERPLVTYKLDERRHIHVLKDSSKARILEERGFTRI